MGLLAHALPQVVQDSIKVLTLSPSSTANANYIPATNIDINVSIFCFSNFIIFQPNFLFCFTKERSE